MARWSGAGAALSAVVAGGDEGGDRAGCGRPCHSVRENKGNRKETLGGRRLLGEKEEVRYKTIGGSM